MVCKVLLQERQCLVAADGKAGMLALKTDVQVSRPLGVIAAAAQTDAYNGEFFAVNAYLLVGNANAEGVSPGTVREIRVCLKILKADLVKKSLRFAGPSLYLAGSATLPDARHIAIVAVARS